MSIHARKEINDLPSEICMYCSQLTWEFEGYDSVRETADVKRTYCENDDTCPIATIDWASLIKEKILKEN